MKEQPKLNKKVFAKTTLEYAYKNKPHPDILGFKLDKELSGTRVQVYHNDEKKQTVVTHRGTKGFADVITDLQYALGDTNSKRFRFSKKVQAEAERKYSGYALVTTGHSLGGALASHSARHGRVITYNGATNIQDAIRTPNERELAIRTSMDPVSMLHTKGEVITIPSETLNPITEHVSDETDKLTEESL